MPQVVQNSSQILLLENVRAAPLSNGLWNDVVIKLFQNDFTPNVNTVLADFTEADFSGYASVNQVATWLTPFVDANGIPRMMNAQMQFDHDGGVTANAIFGYWVEKAITGELLWAERFVDGPFNLALITDAIALTLAIAIYTLISAEVVGS